MKPDVQKLLHLADELDGVRRENFHFGHVVVGSEPPRSAPDCDTIACALGWCGVFFPEVFSYKKNDRGHIALYFNDVDVSRNWHLSQGIADFFGLSLTEFNGLFFPKCQYMVGEAQLERYASASEVAAMIRSFVDKQSAVA